MSIKTNHFNPLIVNLTILLVIVTVACPINSLESRKLDENTLPGDQGIKCTPSCVQSPPPPPSPPALPPPTPKKSPTKYCPPPPSAYSAPSPPSFIYITGPPGSNLYPIDQNFGAGSRNSEVGLLTFISGFLVLVAVGMDINLRLDHS